MARGRGKDTYETITSSVSSEIQGKILKDSVLCTGRFWAYIEFAQNNDLIHKMLDASVDVQVIEKEFKAHNAYYSRLKAWMDRLYSVTIKYLENNLSWLGVLDMNIYHNKTAY